LPTSTARRSRPGARAQRLFDTEHGPGGPRIDPRPAFLPNPDPSLRPFPASSSPDLVAANEALVDILEQAKRLHEDFDQAQSDLEVRIRDLTQWAPDAPKKNWFDRLADSASRMTGIDSLADAVSGFDDLLENSARFLSNLSDVLQGVSAICGTASLLMFWLPGASAALGTLSLAAAGGAAAVKTGLYLTGAKDEYGRPYVRGGELTASLVSFGVGAAGAGVGAAAAKAKDVKAATAAAARGARTGKEAVAGAKAAKDAGSSVASRVAGKFRPGVLKEGLADDMTMLRSKKALFETAGRKAFLERTAAEIGQNFAAMSRPERALVVGGRVVDLGFPIISPLVTGDEPRPKDVGGLRPAIGEIRKLPEEFVRLVEHGSDPLNLRARVEPPEPVFTTPADPIKPVMDS
jgi:hypothetical protein